MKPSDIFLFAAQCLALDENPDFKETVVSTLQDQENNDRFIKLCSDHYILPAVFLKFKKHGLLQVWHENYLHHIEDIYQRNKERNMAILSQIDEINGLLLKENIRAVYLKGTAQLMDGLYSDTGERMISDIDFLVQEKDYFKAARILLQLGYREQSKNFVDLNKLKHYPRLFNEDRPVAVEIHRIPVDTPYTKYYSSEKVFRHCKVPINKSNCFVPSDEHKTIHNFIHCQLADNGYRDKHCNLRSLYDLYLLAGRICLQPLIHQTGFPQQTGEYFACAQKIFQGSEHFPVATTQRGNRLYQRIFYYQDHPRNYKLWLRSKRLLHLIFVRYLFRFIRAIFEQESRKYICRRICDKSWYSYHLNGLRRWFR